MIGESPLSVREFLMQEPFPLGVIHDAVLEFLADRDDVVLFGAQAVNAYTAVPRMTQDVDVAAVDGLALAEELREYLGNRFHIAVRVRDVRDGLGYRIYQVRRDGNRHLVDVRPVRELPAGRWIGRLRFVALPELVAGKVMALVARRHKPKAGSDWRDVAMLLLTFPELKTERGPVRDCLLSAGASDEVLGEWTRIVASTIEPEDEDDEF
jgi:hypothetical protein